MHPHHLKQRKLNLSNLTVHESESLTYVLYLIDVRGLSTGFKTGQNDSQMIYAGYRLRGYRTD